MGIVLLLIVPALWALLLRWARVPGYAVIGGAVGGILLGPTLFGRVLPIEHERLFIGGVEQRHVMDELQRRHVSDLLAAEATGMTADVVKRIVAAHRVELVDSQRELDDARWRDQRPLRSIAFVLVCATLLAAGGIRRETKGRQPTAHSREPAISALHIGAWSAAVPGGIAFVAARVWFEFDLVESALFAAALCIGPWGLTKIDAEAADCGEIGGAKLISIAGRFASIAAIIIAAWAMWRGRGTDGLLFAIPLFTLPIGWLISASMMRATVTLIALPALAACVAAKVDLVLDFAFSPLLVALLLSGDGRWLGAFIGATLPGGRKTLSAMRLVLGASACGPTQLAVATVAIHTWMISATAAYALLAGAVLIEISSPLRRSFAHRTAEMEEQIRDLQ